MQSIHFFRAGQHTAKDGKKIAFSEADLAAIAAAYDPATHEAPIVVGHPKTNAPAYGWIEKIVAKPDGLHAIPRQVNAEFSELVKAGAFKKVSASFYPRGGSSNPRPAAPYLRHIGFLGAEAPALKGLQDIQFSEAEDMFFAEEDMAEMREHSLTVRERAFQRFETAELIKRFQQEGRIPIGLLPGVLAFSETLDASETVEFSEGGATVRAPQTEWFMGFLQKLPVPVMLGEMAGDTLFSEADAEEYPVPEGYKVDPRDVAVARTVDELMKDKKLSFSAAVQMANMRVPR